MSRRSLSAAVAAFASLVLVAPASAADLNAYRVKASAKNLKSLAQAGYDMTEGRRKDGTVEIVATAGQIKQLDVTAKVVKDRAGRTAAQRSARLAPPADPVTYSGSDAEWDVWTRYDAVADGKEQYREQYDRLTTQYDNLVKQETIGTTYLGRPIIALKVTKDAKTTDGQLASGRALQRDAARPRVARRRDVPPHARLLRRELRDRRDGHRHRRQQRAVVRLRVQPGRLRVHVHRRQPAVAQEHGRQRR